MSTRLQQMARMLSLQVMVYQCGHERVDLRQKSVDFLSQWTFYSLENHQLNDQGIYSFNDQGDPIPVLSRSVLNSVHHLGALRVDCESK